MTVTVDLEGLDKALAALRPDIAQKAINRTLNDIMARGKTQATRKVRDRYSIKARQLNNYISVRKSSTRNLEVRLSVRSRNVSLFHFLYGEKTPKLGKRAKGKPVRVKILKQLGVHRLRHAFVMRGKSGNIGIFERVVGVKSSTGKDKIKRLNTVGPAKMFEKVGVDEIEKYADENANRIFSQNFNYYIGKEK